MTIFMKKNALFALLLGSSALAAQNTIGGTVKVVPEKEVQIQSIFVEAEREKLLEHWDKAIEKYNKFLYEHPENDAAWHSLAKVHLAKKDYVNALQAISKACTLVPDNPWYQILKADIYEKTGQAKDAALIYENLLKTSPDNRDYLRQSAYLELLANNPKNSIKALQQLEKVTGITEETAEKKFVIYKELGDNKKAAAELLRLADAYPARPEYRHRLAQFYEAANDRDNARKTYEDILRRYPNDAAAKLALLGSANTSEQQRFEALRPLFANPAAPVENKLREILPYLSRQGGIGNDPALQKSLQDLSDVLVKTHPADPRVLSLAGAVWYQSGRLPEALEQYRQCLRLNPAVFGAWENTLSILDELHQYDEMARVAESAMDAFPNQPKGYFFYALAAIEKGRYDEALSILDQARLMSGNSPLTLDIIDQSGVALTRKKDYPAAQKTFEEGLSKAGGKHALLLEHYGDLMSAQGNKSEAVKYWQQAYDLEKNPTVLQKIKGI
jgi:tetratricopeptide (TPR) repeat protein